MLAYELFQFNKREKKRSNIILVIFLIKFSI